MPPPQLPRWLVITAFLLVLGGLIILFLAGIYRPGLFLVSTAKFFTCFSLSICAAVFLFFLYPQHIEITKIPWLNIPVKLAGPSALFVIVLVLAWRFYPSPTRLFALWDGGQRMDLQVGTIQIIPLGTGCRYNPVADSTPTHLMVDGLLVTFDSSKTCRAQIGARVFEFSGDSTSETVSGKTVKEGQQK